MADRYHGIYAGLVTANDDGEGVLQVQVRAVYPGGESLPTRPALPYGVLFLPEVKTRVWVQYEGGDPTLPLWTGVHQVGDAWPTDTAPPAARVVRTAADHRIVLDDTEGSETIAVVFGGQAHALRLTADGVVVEHERGHAVTIGPDSVAVVHAAGATVEVAKDGVTADAGGSSCRLTATAATVTSGGSSVTVDATGAAVTGAMVRLGPGALPVVRMSDSGIGNLGAPVVMTVVSGTTVTA